LYSAQNWTLSKVDQKYLESFEVMVMEKISWTDCVRNEVLHSVNEDRNIFHIVKRRKAVLVTSRVGTAFDNRRKDKGKDRSDGMIRKKT